MKRKKNHTPKYWNWRSFFARAWRAFKLVPRERGKRRRRKRKEGGRADSPEDEDAAIKFRSFQAGFAHS